MRRQEAQALLRCQCSAEEAALRLGPYSGVVAITDGANGSCISAMGNLKVRIPSPLPAHLKSLTSLNGVEE